MPVCLQWDMKRWRNIICGAPGLRVKIVILSNKVKANLWCASVFINCGNVVPDMSKWILCASSVDNHCFKRVSLLFSVWVQAHQKKIPFQNSPSIKFNKTVWRFVLGTLLDTVAENIKRIDTNWKPVICYVRRWLGAYLAMLRVHSLPYVNGPLLTVPRGCYIVQ